MNITLLYCITTYFGCKPKLTVHSLLKETEHTYTFKVGCGDRRVNKVSQGKKYFTDKDKALEYLKKLYNRELEIAQNTVKRLDRLLMLNDNFIMCYAEDKDWAVNEVG